MDGLRNNKERALDEVSVKEYFDMRFAEEEKKRAAELANLKELMYSNFRAQETAILKSEDSYNNRFALANEFRSAMSDLSGTFATKKTVEEKSEESARRIGIVENRMARLDGQLVTWGAVLTVLAAVISIVGRFVNLGTP